MKSHFNLSKQQRSGIFLLLTIVVFAELFFLWVLPQIQKDRPDDFEIDASQLSAFETEMDSLRKLQAELDRPKIYPFNPNYISDHKGYSLGMSNEEIDRLLAYRAQNKWINSAAEFQQVTKVSDSMLMLLAPNFKFPDWVNTPKPIRSFEMDRSKAKTIEQKYDLNKANDEQLQRVYGIGPALSKRILDKRQQLGGYADMIELTEIYGLSEEVIENLKNNFTIKTPRPITKISLNQATKEDLVKIKYIDYEIAHNIVEERSLREGFKSLNDLLKVKGFPTNRIEIIKLSLVLD